MSSDVAQMWSAVPTMTNYLDAYPPPSMWNSGCEQPSHVENFGWNPTAGSSTSSAVSSIAEACSEMDPNIWMPDGGPDNHASKPHFKFQVELDPMVDISTVTHHVHILGDAAAQAFPFLLDYNNLAEGLPHISDTPFRFGETISAHASVNCVVKTEQKTEQTRRHDPSAKIDADSELTAQKVGKGIVHVGVTTVFGENKHGAAAGSTGASNERSCGAAQKLSPSQKRTQSEAVPSVEHDMCQLCVRAHHQLSPTLKQEFKRAAFDCTVRKRRQMKRVRTENKLGCWWKKYGYTGPRYCQRCSELFRDHIIRQYSNSAGCSRRFPCNDCTRIIKHFTLPLNRAYHKMDKDRPKRRRSRELNQESTPSG